MVKLQTIAWNGPTEEAVNNYVDSQYSEFTAQYAIVNETEMSGQFPDEETGVAVFYRVKSILFYQPA